MLAMQIAAAGAFERGPHLFHIEPGQAALLTSGSSGASDASTPSADLAATGTAAQAEFALLSGTDSNHKHDRSSGCDAGCCISGCHGGGLVLATPGFVVARSIVIERFATPRTAPLPDTLPDHPHKPPRQPA